MSAAADIEAKAAAWLACREEPGWTDADQQALDAWLDAEAAHQAAYWRLEHGWRKADRLAARPPVRQARRSFARAWKPAAVAASLAAVVLAGGLLAVEQGGRRSFSTEVGGRQTVPLADGSRLELNTDTHLRSALSKTERTVWLERGEAYFEVSHDSSRPFVIYAGPRRVVVLGTKFSVRREGDEVKVAVVEGKVRVEPVRAPQAMKPAVLIPGQTVIAKGAETLLAPRSVEEVKDELSWRHGVLTFDQFTVARAAAEFNRYNRRKIVVADPEAGAIRIGGTFKSDNIDGFVELLEEGYGLRIEKQGDEVKIFG